MGINFNRLDFRRGARAYFTAGNKAKDFNRVRVWGNFANTGQSRRTLLIRDNSHFALYSMWAVVDSSWSAVNICSFLDVFAMELKDWSEFFGDNNLVGHIEAVLRELISL